MLRLIVGGPHCLLCSTLPLGRHRQHDPSKMERRDASPRPRRVTQVWKPSSSSIWKLREGGIEKKKVNAELYYITKKKGKENWGWVRRRTRGQVGQAIVPSQASWAGQSWDARCQGSRISNNPKMKAIVKPSVTYSNNISKSINQRKPWLASVPVSLWNPMEPQAYQSGGG